MTRVLVSSTIIHEDYVTLPPDNLPETDGVPLESPWHRAEINLLVESVQAQRHPRTDYYAGGNMFIYYREEQVEAPLGTPVFRGPDFFFVDDVPLSRERRYWMVWKEDGRYPDAIVELLSPKTAELDLTVKKTIYELTFRTSEYYCYDPDTRKLDGWRLSGMPLRYHPIPPDERGWLFCERLGLWLGLWEGEYQTIQGTWLRFFDSQGQLVLLPAEAEFLRAEQERLRAEQERQRAEALQAELARMKAWVEQQGIAPPVPPKQ